jgi:rhamnose transport system permease protein
MTMNWGFLRRWETLLVVILLLVLALNLQLSSHFLDAGNIANIFYLSIEKAIVVLAMAFIIINGEIDLSVASVMGLSATIVAAIYEDGGSVTEGILLALFVGLLCGAANGFFVAYANLPSLVVTLAGLIGYRGIARILLEDRSVGDYPSAFTDMGQGNFLGDFQATFFMLLGLFVLFFIVLHFSAFGRYIYVIGNNKAAAEFAGVPVKRVKVALFMISGFISAFAGILYAARLGNVRANAAEGFELDIITIVLLGGVSIFGGKGTLAGVGLSLLVVLCLRNGMSLSHVDGNTQTSIVGVLLILSVLIPNWLQKFQIIWERRTRQEGSPSLVNRKEHSLN